MGGVVRLMITFSVMEGMVFQLVRRLSISKIVGLSLGFGVSMSRMRSMSLGEYFSWSGGGQDRIGE